MIDRQKVIEGAKHCKATECDGCPYARDGDNTEACSLRLRNDAFALLTPAPDLTPYLATAAIMCSPFGGDKVVKEAIKDVVNIARDLRDEAKAVQP